jgi:hypothetical protein
VDESTRLALLGAEYLTLDYAPTTQQGHKAAENTLQRILAWEASTGGRTNQRRVALLQGFRKAVTAVVSQLAVALDAGRMVHRSKLRASFSGQAISYRNFTAVMDALEGLGEVEHFPGFHNRLWESGAGGLGRASRWRPTATLTAHLRAAGIEPGSAQNHFDTSTEKAPLVLRARKVKKGREQRGDILSIQVTDKTKALADLVDELNEFIQPDRIAGGRCEGFYRVFNAGDHPSFAWNFGGRLYARGEPSYQQLSENKRLQVLIDGESVAEVDVSGSHLTLLYGQHGIPFDATRDPYEVPGIPREVVKAWMVTTLGRNGFPTRWPIERAKELNEAEVGTTHRFPIKLVTPTILQRHPVLVHWPNTEEGYLRLMFLEAEIIIGTMLCLKREHGIPSLPVHDSILVPYRHRNTAASVLSGEFAKRAGVTPKLKIKSARIASG